MRSHGLSRHWLYPRWAGLKQRCCNPESPHWQDYGGRGITICDQWRDDFAAFLADVGEPPDRDHDWSLDRIDNDAGYAPGNVRWALPADQARNKRNSVLRRLPTQVRFSTLIVNGHTLRGQLADLGALLVQARIARGWTQRELAERLGLHMQKIQQYEATSYEGASAARLLEVARALGAVFNLTVDLVTLPDRSTVATAPRTAKRRAR
jgi:DNA-binding XRE family transcriptional regulator